MANDVLFTESAVVTWAPSGATEDFNMQGRLNGSGQYGDVGDLGALPNASIYRWMAETKLDATPTKGDQVRIYLAAWNAAGPDDPAGNLGSNTNQLLGEDLARNMQYIGAITVETALASQVLRTVGLIEIRTRYVTPVWWNDSGAALTNNVSDHRFQLTPVPDQIQ